MISPQLRHELVTLLEARIASLGFRRKSDSFYGDRFVRSSPDTTEKIALEFHAHNGCLDLSVFVGVRLNAVEEMVAVDEEPNSLVTPADVEERTTLGLRLRSWTDAALRWNIKSERDVLAVSDAVVRSVVKKGIPWLSRFGEPQSAMELLAQPFAQVRQYAGPDEISAKKAVALAFRLHGYEAAQAMAQQKAQALKPEQSFELKHWATRLFGSQRDTWR